MGLSWDESRLVRTAAYFAGGCPPASPSPLISLRDGPWGPDESAVADFTLEAGDVVVLGTDGLLDNLFPKQIAALVAAGLAQGVGVQ